MFADILSKLRQISFSKLLSRPVVIAVGVITILALFIVPLPSAILDILIVSNIALSLVLLLQALYSGNIKTFFAFPSILLLSTFYRLSLNISSTRLILLNGDSGMSAAGEVIRSFGGIVVRGDFVVGAIIFAIIAIVNFVVIAKGSARVAEVSARFMLDALPGKQMAIDADMRAGHISREEASEKRNALANESHFFGAMDGAMKFVQGDAIAGLVITGINAFGGVAIGVSRGLELSDAVSSFGVLTIGDGLVNIIPALLISVAAGIIVTQVSNSNLDLKDRGLGMGVVFTSVFALIVVSLLPGFPVFPFLIVALVMLLLFFIFQTSKREAQSFESSMFRVSAQSVKVLPESKDDSSRRLSYSPVAKVEPLAVFVASSYLKEAARKGAVWTAEIEKFSMEIQHEIKARLGIVVPSLRIYPRDSLPLSALQVKIRETQTLEMQCPVGCVFVPLSTAQLRAFGIEVVASAEHPLSLLAGSWVSPQQPLDFLFELGVKVYSISHYWVLAGYGSALDNLDFLLGFEDIQPLIDTSGVVADLCETIFSVNEFSTSNFSELIRNLVVEGVSVGDLSKILEEVALFTSRGDFSKNESLMIELHESLRKRMSRSIVMSALSHTGSLRVLRLDADLEALFAQSAKYWDSPRDDVPIDDDVEGLLIERLKVISTPIRERGMSPVIFICADEVRAVFYNYIKQRFSSHRWVKVLSVGELSRTTDLEQIGVLHID